jgi:ABC-type amino acid transport substrate-binding protein
MYPPFVEFSSGSSTGLTLDLIQLLNESQSEFYFQFILTSPKRRYHDFKRGEIDALFFESKQLGWQDIPISASQVFLQGGEIYITKNDKNKDQGYFTDFKNKKMAGILGYHYHFSNFSVDERFLKENYNINLLNHPNTIINQVLSGQVDIGVITRSYFAKTITNKPNYKDLILASNKLDQEYAHTVLIRDQSALTLTKINNLLSQISNNGSLSKLFLKYGLTGTP